MIEAITKAISAALIVAMFVTFVVRLANDSTPRIVCAPVVGGQCV